ncbi:MAG: TlpA family protein disulfide reductase [Gammaproteobacteria bacterium]|nr:TlpA family protein disulfide reductase [Gammaproteobacteria bacterium]
MMLLRLPEARTTGFLPSIEVPVVKIRQRETGFVGTRFKVMKSVFPRLVLAAIFVSAAVLLWFEIRVTQPEQAADNEKPAAVKLGPFNRIDNPKSLPELHFVDGSGAQHTLADFSGKVVLLNLWATWCPPCREEMPSLDRLHARMGGNDFHVLAISTDLQGISVVQTFYQTAGISSLEAYIDQNGETESALKVPGLPTTLLVDRRGKAIGVKVGPADWDSDTVTAVVNAQIAASVDGGK